MLGQFEGRGSKEEAEGGMRQTNHFMRNTLVIRPCVTSMRTLGQSSSANCRHKLSLKLLTRSYASAADSPFGIR